LVELTRRAVQGRESRGETVDTQKEDITVELYESVVPIPISVRATMSGSWTGAATISNRKFSFLFPNFSRSLPDGVPFWEGRFCQRCGIRSWDAREVILTKRRIFQIACDIHLCRNARNATPVMEKGWRLVILLAILAL
jgi:hypothetical protein